MKGEASKIAFFPPKTIYGGKERPKKKEKDKSWIWWKKLSRRRWIIMYAFLHDNSIVRKYYNTMEFLGDDA